MNIEENTRDWEMYDELNSKIKILEERIAILERRQELGTDDIIPENGIVSRVMTILTNMTIYTKSEIDIQGVMHDKDKWSKTKDKESEDK